MKIIDWIYKKLGYVRCKNCGKWTEASSIWGAICSFKCYDEYDFSIEEQNEMRARVHYPYLLKYVKTPCPKCGGKMMHDEFKKCIDFKNRHLYCFYECLDCEYKGNFDLIKEKFVK